MTIPGVGPVTASAIVATIQDAGVFASGREFAAFLGLTPRQNSTGGKTRLGRITKVGDRYPQRLAESSGNYDELYKARNEMWNET
jgi:transposase